MNKKVELTARIMTFAIDSIAIVVFSIVVINILEEIRLRPYMTLGEELQNLLPKEDYWLYCWIVQLGVALAYHYTAFSLWSASPMQRLRNLTLVTTKGKKPSFIQFSIRLFIKAVVVNIPIYMHVYDQDLFSLRALSTWPFSSLAAK